MRGLAIHGDSIWASGTGGTWLRSTDNGKTWTHGVVPGAESQDFRGVAVLDEKTVLLMSSGPAEKNQAHIYRTADAGAHWSEVFHGTKPGMFLDAIKFWDAKHGIVLSDPVNGKFTIVLSADGGKSWHEAPSGHMPAALTGEGAFAASNSALAVLGKSEAWIGTGGAGHGRVFHSSDGGLSWAVSDTPVAADNASSGIFSLTFANAKHGVAVGGDYQKPTASHDNIAETNDGGRTWKAAGGTLTLFLSGVIAVGPSRYPRYDAIGPAGTADNHRGIWSEGRNEQLRGFNAIAVGRDGTWLAGSRGQIRAPLRVHK